MVLKFDECKQCEKRTGDIYNCIHICDKPLNALKEFNRYKTLEEQGKLRKLPCKVGNMVYVIPNKANYGLNIVNGHKENNRVYEQVVDNIRFYKSGYLLTTCEGHACVIEESYKETWFLTKEEAETALEKLKDVWKELDGMRKG